MTSTNILQTDKRWQLIPESLPNTCPTSSKNNNKIVRQKNLLVLFPDSAFYCILIGLFLVFCYSNLCNSVKVNLKKKKKTRIPEVQTQVSSTSLTQPQAIPDRHLLKSMMEFLLSSTTRDFRCLPILTIQVLFP